MIDASNDTLSPAISWRKLNNFGLIDCYLDSVSHMPVTLSAFDHLQIKSRGQVTHGNEIPCQNDRLSPATVVTTHQFCDVYYHWVFDIIPRVINSIAELGEFSNVLLPKPRLRFQTEWLEIAVAKGNWSYISDTRSYIPGPVYIPSSSTTGTVVSPWAVSLIKSLGFKIQPSKNTPRIYIRRQGNVHRKIGNETELERALKSKGFIVIDAASISVREQIALFKGAEIVVSAHGSALTNLVFCQPQTSVIEIFGPYCEETCYPRIAHQVQMRHIGILANELFYFNPLDRFRHAFGAQSAPFHFKVDPDLVLNSLSILGH